MTTNYAAITNETLVEVGASWVQANRDKYAWTKFPRCTVKGQALGHGSTAYNLPALDNYLQKSDGLSDWAYGAARRAARDLGKVAVTATPLVQDITPITRPMTMAAATEHIWADLAGNIIPGQLSMLYQGMELRLATLLTDGTLGDTQLFSGTGELDTYMTNTDHDPIGDILSLLESTGMRWKREAIGGTIAMCISPRVTDLFMRHPAFNGSGAASGVAQVVPKDIVFQHLSATLGIDEIIEFTSAADTVRLGQTSAPALAGRNVLAFQVFDSNKSRNLAANPFDTPEGSACLFEAEAPNVTTAEDADTKVVKFNGDVEYVFQTPRGSSWGLFFPASEMFA